MARDPLAASVTVECLGLPGVGKSRLCQTAGAALHARGATVRVHLRRPAGPGGRLLTAGRTLGLLARRPAWCRQSLRSIRTAAPTEAGWLARTWLKRSAAAHRRALEPGIHLTDAGVAQALWSLAFRARTDRLDELLASLAAAAPLPDHLLLLEADSALLVRRLAESRGPLRGTRRRLAQEPGALDRGHALIERLAALLASPGRDRAAAHLLRLVSRDENDLSRNVETVIALCGDRVS